jgi:hypothetical protein
MAASLKDKRTPITTPPHQVPSVDVTPDPPIYSLVTTFNYNFKQIFLCVPHSDGGILSIFVNYSKEEKMNDKENIDQQGIKKWRF